MNIEFDGNSFEYREFSIDMTVESCSCDCCGNSIVLEAYHKDHDTLKANTLEEIVYLIDNYLNGKYNHLLMTIYGKEYKIYVHDPQYAERIIDSLNSTKEKLRTAFNNAKFNFIGGFIEKHHMRDIYCTQMYISAMVAMTEKRVINYCGDKDSKCEFIDIGVK